jgi:glycosyltransferase involved in cell wall biosynthesis
MIYVPTAHVMNWGWMLDQAWAQLFDGRGDRFWASAHAHHKHKNMDVSRDSGLVHSVLSYGEPDWSWLAPQNDADIHAGIAKERMILGRFRRRWTLSRYCRAVLEQRGLSCEGVLRYPFIVKDAYISSRRHKQVVVPQRFSQEKLPIVVFHLAQRMRDWVFRFTCPRPWEEADPILRAWMTSAHTDGMTTLEFAYCPDRESFYRELSQASVCLSTSAYDTFGVAGFEAMSMGVPFVAPRMFAFPEFVPSECLYEPWSLDNMEWAIGNAAVKNYVETPWTLADSLDDIRRLIAVHSDL